MFIWIGSTINSSYDYPFIFMECNIPTIPRSFVYHPPQKKKKENFKQASFRIGDASSNGWVFHCEVFPERVWSLQTPQLSSPASGSCHAHSAAGRRRRSATNGVVDGWRWSRSTRVNLLEEHIAWEINVVLTRVRLLEDLVTIVHTSP